MAVSGASKGREVGRGWRALLTLGVVATAAALTSAGLPRPAQAQSKRLQYDGFVCDVYGGQAAQVMGNDPSNLAYDFNVTELGPGSYVAVFHAEPYRKAPGCWGDSVAVRYAASPDGDFGDRAGNCNDCPGDQVITRTAGRSEMMSSDECTGLGGVSGGGNPILLQRQGNPAWTLFYLAVSDFDEAANAHTGWWRHYLMVAHPTDVGSMLSCDWAALAREGGADTWRWFVGQPPKWQDYQPWPARLQSNGALLQSAQMVFQSADTQGLIGNISYDGSRSRIHYFYIDIVDGQNVTRRQDMVDLDNVNWWSDAVTVRNDWVNAAFHVGRGRWAVLANCWDGGEQGWDVCLQFTPSPEVGDIGALPPADQVAHGLGLAAFFDDPVTGGIMEQYGFLKNPYGQIPGDDFRIYVTERTAAGGLYGMDMYSVRVACSCTAAPCEGQCCVGGQVCAPGGCCTPSCAGRTCGDDGCGGSCGGCAPGESCQDPGRCVPDGCVADCAGRSCGPDPICDLSCGDCALGERCSPHGECLPPPVDPDLGPGPGSDAGPDPRADLGPGPGFDAGSDPRPDLGPGPGSDAGSDPRPDLGPGPGPDVSPGTDPDLAPEGDPDVDPASESPETLAVTGGCVCATGAPEGEAPPGPGPRLLGLLVGQARRSHGGRGGRPSQDPPPKTPFGRRSGPSCGVARTAPMLDVPLVRLRSDRLGALHLHPPRRPRWRPWWGILAFRLSLTRAVPAGFGTRLFDTTTEQERPMKKLEIKEAPKQHGLGLIKTGVRAGFETKKLARVKLAVADK